MNARIARRRALQFAGAACASLVLSGCGTDSARAGLYVAGPDGAPRWIAETTGAPAWSPNGETLAWGDEHGLSMWNVATDQISLLTATRVVGRPAWSPDSSEIAFLDPQTRLLRTLNVQSGITTPLSILYEGSDGAIRPPIVTRGGPAWSPDGLRIAFICWDGQGDELCVFDAAGDIRQQVTTLGGTGAGNSGPARSSVTSMAWSPDGVAIAVAVQAEQKGATAGVFRVELAVKSGTRLTKTTVNAPIVWEAATDDLVFSASVEGRSDVYRLPAAGGKPSAMTLALADGAREPAVDDAGALAVVSGSRIAVLRPGSDEVTYLEEAGLVGAAPALSADGKHLAYLALRQPIEQYP
ncbi:MAG: hypothetical protein M3Z20_06030 [Chloroflexota bacterium]|nr:hypothetical protein [Chloroflexota bacterium]